MEPVTIGPATLYNADCLTVLPLLEAESVNAVITDPPYMVGAVSVGNAKAKSGTWADMENSAWWFAAWFREAKRVLNQKGFLVSCGNWRSVPTLICGLSKCDWSATSCLIWDKQWIGPAYKNALRPTYELAMFAAMPEAEIPDRCASDIFRGQQWLAGACRTTDHAAEKPVDLMEHLVRLTTENDGLVVDPFLGSGTTGVACIKNSRRFIGIEKDERHFATAVRRIREAVKADRDSLFPAFDREAVAC